MDRRSFIGSTAVASLASLPLAAAAAEHNHGTHTPMASTLLRLPPPICTLVFWLPRVSASPTPKCAWPTA